MDSGFYVGARLGQSKANGFADDSNMQGSRSQDDTSLAWAIEAGYLFNANFGVGTGYIDFGEVSDTVSVLGYFRYAGLTLLSDMESTGTGSASGMVLSLNAAMPVGNVDFAFKTGLLFAKTEFESSFTARSRTQGLQFSYREQADASTVEYFGEIGLGYTFSDHVRVSIDWMFVPDLGDEEETGESDVNLLSAGVQFRF